MDATPLHQNSGGQSAAVSATPIVVSLAGTDATADGSTLIVCFVGGSTQQVGTAPSGWVKFGPAAAGSVKPTWFRRGPVEGLVAGETSWSFNPTSGVAAPLVWVILEYPNLDPDAPLDVLPASLTSNTTGTTSVNTTGLTSSYDALVLSFHGSYMSTGGTPDTWGSHTGGFTELVEQSVTDGTKSVDLSVSALAVQSLSTYGPTATASRTLDATNPGFSLTFVLTSASARKAADLRLLDGAEQGTITGVTLGTAGFKVLDFLNGGVTVEAGAARSGGYGWRLQATAGLANFGWQTLGSVLGQRPVLRRCFRARTSLPTADVKLLSLVMSDSTEVVLRYLGATAPGKLGLRVGTGTEQVSDAAGIVAAQWFAVDLRGDGRTTSFVFDWSVDYNAELTDAIGPVSQAQATFTGIGIASGSTYRVGWDVNSTADFDTDDGAGSATAGHYPLGDVRVLSCKVDPAGTPSISGTATNFGVMTNNGTVAAWDATNARNAVDDVPPDLSATRDAAVAVTASATDYAEFPMQTYDAAGNGAAIRGVRAIFCLWAASATAATIRLLAHDGTTTYTLFAEADPNADNTATPVWMMGMLRGSSRTDWTQAKLDALVLRFGSNDATPDIGVDSMLLEVAVVRVPAPQGMFGVPGDVQVTASRDPDSAGIVTLATTTPEGKGAALHYEVNSTPTDAAVAPNASRTDVLGAPDAPTVNYVALYSDPEPVTDT